MLRSDLGVYDKNNRLILTIETKNKLGTSRKWASEFKRNILHHGSYPLAPYFLMIFPDKLYLWKDPKPSTKPTSPDYEEDASKLFSPYFKKAGVSAEEIYGSTFEMIVASWLNDLILFPEKRKKLKWMEESKLAEALEGGSYKFEVTA